MSFETELRDAKEAVRTARYFHERGVLVSASTSENAGRIMNYFMDRDCIIRDSCFDDDDGIYLFYVQWHY